MELTYICKSNEKPHHRQWKRMKKTLPQSLPCSEPPRPLRRQYPSLIDRGKSKRQGEYQA
uniref:Uncharacterized protein n=1 Tax=Cucumis melo TaxID=3656 RepID=A0A9I9E5J4_CUCME